MYVRANDFVPTRLHRLDLITHGAPLRTLRVRELRYIQELPVKGVCVLGKIKSLVTYFFVYIPQDNNENVFCSVHRT